MLLDGSTPIIPNRYHGYWSYKYPKGNLCPFLMWFAVLHLKGARNTERATFNIKKKSPLSIIVQNTFSCWNPYILKLLKLKILLYVERWTPESVATAFSWFSSNMLFFFQNQHHLPTNDLVVIIHDYFGQVHSSIRLMVWLWLTCWVSRHSWLKSWIYTGH